MHCFVVSAIVFSSVISIGQCFPMVITAVNDGVIMYGIIELETIREKSWVFIIKSTQVVKDANPGLITSDCTGWLIAEGNKCRVRFSDESIYQATTLVDAGQKILIEGEIDHVQHTKRTILKDIVRVFIKINNPISINQHNLATPREAFNGFKLEGMRDAVILLVVQRNRESELLESFEAAITSHVEMGQGENFKDKQEILLQPLAIGPDYFGSVTFLFMKYFQVQQIQAGGYEIGNNEILNQSKCAIKISLAKGSKNALGMFTFLNLAGSIWIQSIVDTQTKPVNTAAEFGALKGLNECRISRNSLQAEATNDLATSSSDNWITLNIGTINFNHFTKKFLLYFDFGNRKSLYFSYEGKIQRVEVHENTRANLFTLFGDHLDKFEEARSQASRKGADFKVMLPYYILPTESIKIDDLNILILNPSVTPQLGNDNVFKIPVWQYSYKE